MISRLCFREKMSWLLL